MSALVHSRVAGVQSELADLFRESRDTRVKAQILMNQAVFENPAMAVAFFGEVVRSPESVFQDPMQFQQLMSVAVIGLGVMAASHPDDSQAIGSLLVDLASRYDIGDSVFKDAAAQLAVSHPEGLHTLSVRLRADDAARLRTVHLLQTRVAEGARIDAPFVPRR